MFRLITIEREYGCGGGAIAEQLRKNSDGLYGTIALPKKLRAWPMWILPRSGAATSAWIAAFTDWPKLSGAAAMSAALISPASPLTPIA